MHYVRKWQAEFGCRVVVSVCVRVCVWLRLSVLIATGVSYWSRVVKNRACFDSSCAGCNEKAVRLGSLFTHEGAYMFTIVASVSNVTVAIAWFCFCCRSVVGFAWAC